MVRLKKQNLQEQKIKKLQPKPLKRQKKKEKKTIGISNQNKQRKGLRRPEENIRKKHVRRKVAFFKVPSTQNQPLI